LIDARDASNVIVVHEGAEYAFAYFPLHFRYGARLKQYLAGTEPLPRLKPLGENRVEVDAISPADDGPRPIIVVVRTRNCATDEIRHALHGVPLEHDDGPFAHMLKAEPGWTCIEEKQTTAFVGASISVFRHASAEWPALSNSARLSRSE